MPRPVWAHGQGYELPLFQVWRGLLRWCVGQGMIVIKQMTLTAIGGYAEPRGCWVPSVLY
jgi:hypothetical protein